MTSRRFLFVVLVAVLAVAALVAGRGTAPAPAASVAADVGPHPAALTRPDPVWFCPGLPPALPHASARVTFANLAESPADVVVTVLADKGGTTRAALTVAPRTVVTRPRDRLGAPGALTVETFGGRVVVEEGIDQSDALATTPCATQTSPHWYFAAGSTPRGVQQWLVIDNPYASDARVDVTLRTSDGLRRPDALQGLDVARRSRAVIAIHDVAVRARRVAIAVNVEVGSVVASQTLRYTADAGTPGVALSLGVPVAATETSFAGGVAASGATSVVAIANVGSDDAQVDVQAMAVSGKPALPPVSLAVAQDDVVWVGLGACPASSAKTCLPIPDGVRYTLDVRSEQNVAIVAQTFTRSAAGDVAGTVTSPGVGVPARSWVFARSVVTGERSTALSLWNPGAVPATVDVAFVHSGIVERPRSMRSLTVPPGRAITVLAAGGRRVASTDAAVVIDSSEPIVVDRTIAAAHEASSAVGAVG